MLGEDPPLKVLDDLAALAREAFARAQTDELRVIGVGVAVPGLVDVGLRTLLRAPNLGWTQVAIGAELEARLGLPAGVVAVGNEANLAALAELWDGVARDLPSFIHITGQVGVGAGIVIDGELTAARAASPASSAHDRAPRRRTVRVRRPRLPGDRRRPRGDPRPRRHGAAARRRRVRDGRAARAARGCPRRGRDHAIDEAAEALGIALSSAINLLDLEALVLGGSCTPLCPWLVPRVRDALRRACSRRRGRSSTCAAPCWACRRRCAARPPSTSARCSTARGS